MSQEHAIHAVGWVWKSGWMDGHPYAVPNGTEEPSLLSIGEDGWVEPTDDHDGFYYYDYEPRSSDFLFTRYFTAVFDVLVDAEQDKASTDEELVVGLILHLLYEAINGFVIGTLTTLVMESRRSKQDFEDKINAVIEFCQYNKLSANVTRRVRRAR